MNANQKTNLTNIETLPQAVTVFPTAIAIAVSELKSRLQEHYEQAYPGLSEIIRLVLDDEEARAWELTSFPHLILPDLIEAHVATLGLEPAGARQDNILAPITSRPLTLAAFG